jgi:ATP-dependent helicase/nuclease subunit A
MSQLTVYKASAGSGKTFRLTVEYLKLLLGNPEAYRHILAVTFTNKATAEMKERVLGALETLSRLDTGKPAKGLAGEICKELSLTPEQAKNKSILALSFLLHDYGRFRVETIDSFFQSVLRNLARELGLGAGLNTIINNSDVLEEAVDNLIDKADENPELLLWITEFIEEMLDEGKSWQIDRQLKDFGNHIFKEYFKEKESQLEAKLSDKSFLKNYKKLLKIIEKESLDSLKRLAEPFFTLLEANGLTENDFSNKASGPCGYFLKLRRGEADASIFQGARVQAALEDPSKWSTKTSPLFQQISRLAEAHINPLLLEAEAKRQALWNSLVTAKLASRHLNQIGLLSDIAAEVRMLNYENHQFLLSNTNALLKTLLDGSDASFVYEKTGVELHHILFDEFQDTSRMQWDTFKPLLQEGLSNGYRSLIVGDEKQSIYRWRNGDWRILGNIRSEIAPSEVEENVLTNNWRSARNIVEFNNSLFTHLEKTINGMHQSQFNHPSEELTKAYADVAQIPTSKETEGLIQLTFLSTKENDLYRQTVLKRLIEQIEQLQRSGVRPDQIAILIRVKKEVPEIGAFLTDYKSSGLADPNLCYEIVSDEAFQLRSSRAVQVLINALRLLNEPLNPIHQALIKLDYQTDVLSSGQAFHDLFRQQRGVPKTESNLTAYKKSFVDNTPELQLLPEEFTHRFETLQRLPLYELVEELYRIFEVSAIPDQDSFLHCFMDKLSEYLLHAPADISSFLKHWDTEMSTTSIPAGSSVQGIRILTIHKSKGLEFHTVLIPFCDWKLLDTKRLKVWCTPKAAPYDQLDLLPIDYKKEMADSIFSEEYADETLQLWVDALNLLYVAFTRAKYNLIVWAKGNDDAKQESKPDSIGKLLQDKLRAEATEDLEHRYEQLENDGDILISGFRWGQLLLGEAEDTKTKGTSDIALSFHSYAHKTSFRQSNRSKEFCKVEDSNEATSGYIDRGNLLHRLFQDIRQKDDLPLALLALVHEGLISSDEASVYGEYAEKALSNDAVKDWYSGKYKLFNECSILCPGPDGKVQLKRPDRVMQGNHEVLVVDFKFGKEKRAHHHQVQEYMQLLSSMGHSTVKGYLWYVDENRLLGV